MNHFEVKLKSRGHNRAIVDGRSYRVPYENLYPQKIFLSQLLHITLTHDP